MLSSIATPLALVLSTSLIIATFKTFYSRRKLPPGPVGLPLLGHVLQLPQAHLASHFRRLIDEYGGLVSLNLAGLRIVLIGDIKVAKELLERHSAKHSSRHVMPYIRQYIDPAGDYFMLSKEGESHTMGRKLTAGIMSTVRAGKTEPLQAFEALLNIQLLLDDGGKNWFQHIERLAASMVLSAAFGMHCPTSDDRELNEFTQLLAEAIEVSTPTASIINAFTFLDWLPGPVPWRTRGQSFHNRERDAFRKLIDGAIAYKAAGIDTWAATFADTDKPEGDQSRLIKPFAVAAIGTTSATLQAFVLACILYPQWIFAAQNEIDNVVGPDRLPSFKDRPNLPYVEAIVREALRWRPVARFGIPHQSTADDVIEYQGQEYFIPKGSILCAVAWAMEHDESIYPDPDRFMPERFLNSDGKLKKEYTTSAFGFGRRLCPGIPFAERAIFINIASMLWTFNIKRSDQPDAKTGTPFQYDASDAAFVGDLSSPPNEFPAVFEARSPQRAEVARREWTECEKDFRNLLPAAKNK